MNKQESEHKHTTKANVNRAEVVGGYTMSGSKKARKRFLINRNKPQYLRERSMWIE